MTYHVALAKTIWEDQEYLAGEIVVIAEGPGPSGQYWATFTPPEDLSGLPVLIGTARSEGEILSFAYKTDSGIQFVVRAKAHMAEAVCLVVPQEFLDEPEALPAPGVKVIEGSAFTGSIQWRKRDSFGIPSTPILGESDLLRGTSSVDIAATNRRNNAIVDAQIERERSEAKRIKEARERELQDALQAVQTASRENLPGLIAQFQEKAAGDPAYTRLTHLAQEVFSDFIAEEVNTDTAPTQ